MALLVCRRLRKSLTVERLGEKPGLAGMHELLEKTTRCVIRLKSI